MGQAGRPRSIPGKIQFAAEFRGRSQRWFRVLFWHSRMPEHYNNCVWPELDCGRFWHGRSRAPDTTSLQVSWRPETGVITRKSLERTSCPLVAEQHGILRRPAG